MTEAIPDAFEKFIPTIKLSDDLGKHSGKADEIELCERDLRLN